MRLTFLGTRGEIAARSRRHWRHAAALIEAGSRRIMIDAGSDWLGRLERLRLDALIVTHAHPDHIGALRSGSPCPVHATAATWRLIEHWPIRDRHVLAPWRPHDVGGLTVEAVPVVHSVRAPAVGYRFGPDRPTAFYVPDIAELPRASHALTGVQLYIGDGATIVRPILRGNGRTLTGHTSIAAQLSWCRDHGVARAVFTHCGSQIVRTEHAVVRDRVAALGRDRGVEASIACDGDRIEIPDR
jgi:phosphoribosyl 1,2-cyclic phosphodiesterase